METSLRSVRRTTSIRFLFGGCLIVGCLGIAAVCFAQNVSSEKPADASAEVDRAAQAAAEFKSCLDQLRPDALRRVSQKTLDAAFSGLQPDLELLERLRTQPEFSIPIRDYVDSIVNERRILDGQNILTRFQSVFDAVDETYGVDRYIIAAIWGVETSYGADLGGHSVVRATATLACIGRRQDYFRHELLAALEILERGDIAAQRFTGSWSGAFGGTQFMPTNLLQYGVDFDGNGRRNIVEDVPDIIASTANLVRAYGWDRDKPCLLEVTLPSDFDFSLVPGRRSFMDWERAGLSRVARERTVNQNDLASLMMPGGYRGPAFLQFENFQAILRYNPAEAYAFAVCTLADRLRGGEPIAGSWPRDERMLTSGERFELQSLLAAMGFDVGPIDRMIGTRTRTAVREFQKRYSLIADGFVSTRLLERLRHP